MVLARSADTVAEQLEVIADTLNVGHLITQPIFGSMPREIAFENTRRFAEEVMPRLRPKFAEWEDRWTPRPETIGGQRWRHPAACSRGAVR